MNVRKLLALRDKLGNEISLNLLDFTKPFRLACDASNIALGVVLSLVADRGHERQIALASRNLSKTEKK